MTPNIYAGRAGELLRRAEDEALAYQAAAMFASSLPWWRFRKRRRWRALAENHRRRAFALVKASEAADA